MQSRTRVAGIALLVLASSWAAPPHAGSQPIKERNRVVLETVERRTVLERGGMGFLVIGFHELDLGDLNRGLGAVGFLPFRERPRTIGGAGWGVRGRWMLGGEGHAFLVPSRSQGGYETRFTSGYGMLDVGYRIVATEGLDVFPMLGLGGGGIVLEITESGAVTFDDVLADPGRGARVSGATLALALSLGAAFKSPPRAMRRGEGGLAIGVRAGYLFSKSPNDWKLNEQGDVIGLPDVTLSGPFAALWVGGWGRR